LAQAGTSVHDLEVEILVLRRLLYLVGILNTMMAPAEDAEPAPASAVTVWTIAGGVMVEISPVPMNAGLLKTEIEARCGVPTKLQRLMRGVDIMLDGDVLTAELLDATLTLVVDESPLFSWDIANNPNSNLLTGEGGVVVFAGRLDYVNVVTQEPIRNGLHFFEFVMHEIGDEQWCGVVTDQSRAGYHGSNLGWFYYCGRRSHRKGALHAPFERCAQEEFEHVKNGDVIGMLVDVDEGALVFVLNQTVQGACVVPKQPLYLSTSPDEKDDRVELRKLPVADAPAAALEAIKGPLLMTAPIADGNANVESDADLDSDA